MRLQSPPVRGAPAAHPGGRAIARVVAAAPAAAPGRASRAAAGADAAAAAPPRPAAARRQQRRTAAAATAAPADAPPAPAAGAGDRSHEADVVIIGSGIGGLCCGALLARYGLRVTVCESHSVAGGAAHTFERDGYHFESGPSLYSGMDSRGPGANPLAHVFQAIGEDLELIKYNEWNVLVPEGQFLTRIGNDNFFGVLDAMGKGPAAKRDWARLQEVMKPLARAATLLPPVAIRFDPGVVVSALGRYLPQLLSGGADALKLTGPFSKILDGTVSDPFIKNWMNLLCFLLSGLPADGTIAAEVAFMFDQWYRPDCQLDFPVGGSQAMVQALVRGIEKRSGRVLTNAHVERITTDPSGRADGVALRGGARVRARRAVVSNASAWDTARLVRASAAGAEAPSAAAPLRRAADAMERSAGAMPACPSFMHLHVGFDAAGLPPPELHHIVVNSWERGVDAEQNVVLVSIPSVVDPSMAPPGKHCLHAYVPATEPYSLWEGLDRRSPEYAALKEERSRVLWDAAERAVPGIRARAEVTMVGTPLTHGRYLRRHRGSYGPAIRAGEGLFPGPSTPLPGLYACGDSTFPGIGLPAVAASGAVCANTLAPLGAHLELLGALGL
ncbi:carotene isomerase [Raphidocelis subcapitata]|uniref:Carotene isomerase n=1 Tax=Raphidocelis subcapitata TaxID=307507 RepID=A0A2V0P9R6_9CHLO|nr:carotene isomerase [Raphidocelis subcapitata]|eukprot:GBF96586.1 carotene isomerase [Raphidocelis subcapitata]